MDVEATGAGRGDGGGEDLPLFPAQQPPLAGVRVEAGERDPAAGVPVQAVERLAHRLGSDPVERLAQGEVDVEQGHLELGGEEHHQVVAPVALEAADLGEIVGVPHEAGEVLAGDRLLADRRRHQGVRGAGADQRDPGVERRHRPRGVGGAGVPQDDGAGGADRIEGEDRLRARGGDLGGSGSGGPPSQAVPGNVGKGGSERLDRGALGDQHGLPGGGGGIRGIRAEELQQDLGADPRGIPLREGEDGTGNGTDGRAHRSESPPSCLGRRPCLSSSSLNR